jgi:hypothetical protein
MHCSDSILTSYSSYLFRRVYVIIREPSVVCPAELHFVCLYVCVICQRVFTFCGCS